MDEDIKNTEAKYLLSNFDFSEDNHHIAYTINSFGGSAAGIADEKPYLFKSENFDLTDDQKSMLEEIKKSSEDVSKSEIIINEDKCIIFPREYNTNNTEISKNNFACPFSFWKI